MDKTVNTSFKTNPQRVLVACEYSGTVRDAFLQLGHDAWSNDIIPTDSRPDRHYIMDVSKAISLCKWDIIIIHIPCTAMAVCGNSTYGTGKPRNHERRAAMEWSVQIWDEAVKNCGKVAMENPASVLFPVLRSERGADVQYIQPYEFGHLEQKKTGLALGGIPRLKGTKNVLNEMMELPKNIRERVHYMAPSPDRAKERARFYKGFADAMAHQWGGDAR